MKANPGLPEQVTSQIAEVLARFPEIERAVLFGSRAKGTHHPGSDIDLALAGTELDWRKLGRIDDALDDLMLPYGFSLIELGPKTDPDLAAHIRRVGMIFYERAPLATKS